MPATNSFVWTRDASIIFDRRKEGKEKVECCSYGARQRRDPPLPSLSRGSCWMFLNWG